MSDRVTIAQVAEEAGVSAMTVSNVLNGRPGASEETRRRVLECRRSARLPAEPLGAQPQGGPHRADRRDDARPDRRSTAWRSSGASPTNWPPTSERCSSARPTRTPCANWSATQFLARGLVDGVLMVAPALEDDTLEALRRKNLPCVVIDPRRTDVSLPRVTVDNYGGTRQAAEHLLDLGHTRIAYIRGISDLESSELRYQGFHDALRLAGRRRRSSAWSPSPTSPIPTASGSRPR